MWMMSGVAPRMCVVEGLLPQGRDQRFLEYDGGNLVYVVYLGESSGEIKDLVLCIF